MWPGPAVPPAPRVWKETPSPGRAHPCPAPGSSAGSARGSGCRAEGANTTGTGARRTPQRRGANSVYRPPTAPVTLVSFDQQSVKLKITFIKCLVTQDSGPRRQTGKGTRPWEERPRDRDREVCPQGCPPDVGVRRGIPPEAGPRGGRSRGLCSVRFGEATGPGGDGGRGLATCRADAAATGELGSFLRKGG